MFTVGSQQHLALLSTVDRANQFVEVQKKVKLNQKFEKITVKKPFVIERYNVHMNAVNKLDQMLSKYNLLRKCVRWWKTLFFHIIDISIVNVYILFREYQKSH